MAKRAKTVTAEHPPIGRRQHRYSKLVSPAVKVQITQREIDNSIKRNSHHCMIAEALQSVLPNAGRVSADLATIRFTDKAKGLRYIYLTPRPAQIALIRFDRGEKVQPFAVELIRAAQIVRSTAPWTKRHRDCERERQRVEREERAACALRGEESDEERGDPTKSPRDDRFDRRGKPRMQKETRGSVPTVIGGSQPPVGNLARTRKYGIRQFLE